jgi:hypothetical protein
MIHVLTTDFFPESIACIAEWRRRTDLEIDGPIFYMLG